MGIKNQRKNRLRVEQELYFYTETRN